MTSFDIAIEKVLAHEVINYGKPDQVSYTPGLPHDSGGETNWGISKRAYPNLDIKNLTKEQAIEIYKKDYWLKEFENENFQEFANAGLDFAVTSGPQTSWNILSTSRSIEEFTVKRLKFYRSLHGWRYFAETWTTRSLDY